MSLNISLIMKRLYILFCLLLSSVVLSAQIADTIIPANGNIENQLKEIRKRQIILHSDSTKNGNVPKKTALIDSTKKNRYNDLLDDDPEYNKKYPVWKPALQVV